MPQISRYSDEQVEQLLAELLNVLEKHKAPTDLSLMVLGNMVNTSIAPAQRQAIANSFARALQSSINEDKAHLGKQITGYGNSSSALP